jgi:CheY-like chemotaxis protein
MDNDLHKSRPPRDFMAPLQTGADLAAPLRVLLVDDHDDVLMMLGLVMKRRSYCVATANTAHQALEVMESFAPHVVVSDIALPEMDGCEMMTTLRAMEQLTPFRSIALTGYDFTYEQDRLRDAGYDAHLTKPVNLDELFGLIDQLAGTVKEVDLQQEPPTKPGPNQ